MATRRTGEGRRVAVVGSGISGLSAALRLEQSGHDVEVIERDSVLGGRFGVGRLGDRRVMMGGKNIGRKYTAFRSFTAALGSYPWEQFGINQSFMKDDEVLTVDSTRRSSSLNSIRQMATPRDLARLGRLAAQIRLDDSSRFLGSDYFTRLARKYDRRPLSSHFSAKVTKNLLRPLTVRMNGAEPDEVYLGTFGTNLSLLMDTYDQLSGGIEPALEALARRVTVRLDTEVTGLVVRQGKAVGLRLSHGGTETERSYDGIVIATPAYATAQIVRSEMSTLSKRLGDVRYFGSSVVLVEYDRPIFTPEVRALAINDGGPCSNAGSYAMESRHIVRYTYSGRPGRIDEQDQSPLDDWVGETEERLVRYLGASRAQRVHTGGRSWSAAYCAYVPFHGEFLREVSQAVDEVPGLELAGDYLMGASLESCCRTGRSAADRLAAALGAPEAARVGR